MTQPPPPRSDKSTEAPRDPARAVPHERDTRHLDRLLDLALEQSFPASDPVAIGR